MRVYVLHFASLDTLSRAFDRLLGSSRVGSCMIEQQERRLRFVAPRHHAEALLQRFYAEGGLTWCSAHDVVVPEEADPRPRERALLSLG